ncbi:MAG: TIGR03936 family radical SAM-associated protein [Treponema sp.]|jgi:radical SAM-linked protein|nr:TIGR03936 family radical SAM-associated protein [Treponema sp.]
MEFIDPVKALGRRLLEVENPARYVGGEYGSLALHTMKDAALKTAVVFPDLYEIGMSNQAFRILYNNLNSIEGVSCDRAFSPAPDFEKLLERAGIPLYGLDSGIPLKDCRLLLVSLGYELGITGVLSVLQSARIPLESSERGEGDPVVIMGGPCVSNPLPYSRFIDCFWIGEAEAGFFDLCRTLARHHKRAPRKELLDIIVSREPVWAKGKTTPVKRAVFSSFGTEDTAVKAVFPVPNFKVVQHHGAVEIMRGCPNGCRFCHAGIWYRPMRQKRADVVVREAEEFIRTGGYREISLSSLSSGDYCGLNELLGVLNADYAKRHISFQLPSLKVSGFSLSLLGGISEVRKSGLTFAVETPLEADQLSINKQVSLDEIAEIIGEARKQGWRGAKFYFMIGLPVSGAENEHNTICDFILEASRRTKMHFSVTVGVFVPKAHTPYQRAAQLDEETAWQKLHTIQRILKARGHKVGIHDPFVSKLEGVLSRGDERVGGLVKEAFTRGCRLDAWSDHIRKDLWRDLFDQNKELAEESLRQKECNEQLPWYLIESGVNEQYISGEYKNSECGTITPPCAKNCTHPCGICNSSKIVANIIQAVKKAAIPGEEPGAKTPAWRMLFTFTKLDKAVYVSHLGINEVFSMAFTRAELPCVFTEGFNPLVKMQIASPVSVGIECRGEVACVDFITALDSQIFMERFNSRLPQGFRVTKAQLFTIPFGAKKHSLSSLLWGFRYGTRFVAAAEDKAFRGVAVDLKRDEVLAKHADGYGDYFLAYRELYGSADGTG